MCLCMCVFVLSVCEKPRCRWGPWASRQTEELGEKCDNSRKKSIHPSLLHSLNQFFCFTLTDLWKMGLCHSQHLYHHHHHHQRSSASFNWLSLVQMSCLLSNITLSREGSRIHHGAPHRNMTTKRARLPASVISLNPSDSPPHVNCISKCPSSWAHLWKRVLKLSQTVWLTLVCICKL